MTHTYYKTSRYNVFFNRDDNDYIWNTFSGALIRLTAEGKKYIQEFDNKADNSIFFEKLLENGCIVDERLDELGKVLYDEKSITMNNFPSKLHYTIAPGLSCNYACVYCFENHRISYARMSDKTQKEIYDYLCARMLENPNLKGVSITWFGGEPLLYTDIIHDFSVKIISFCKQNNLDYYSGIISNGRFLNKQNVALLRECKIGHIQLSVDGMNDFFIKQKNATNFDFEQTITNIEYASQYLPISIRINVINSINEAIKLTDYLLRERKLDGKIKMYIAHVREYDKRLSPQEEQKAHGHFLDQEALYMKLFGSKYLKKSFKYNVPRRRGTSCLSSCNTNVCIGPKGEIYQCEHHFGIKDSEIGSISGNFYYRKNKLQYLQFKHHKKCLKCNFFPICLGGCIDDMVNGRNMINCTKYKNRLIDLLMFDK